MFTRLGFWLGSDRIGLLPPPRRRRRRPRPSRACPRPPNAVMRGARARQTVFPRLLHCRFVWTFLCGLAAASDLFQTRFKSHAGAVFFCHLPPSGRLHLVFVYSAPPVRRSAGHHSRIRAHGEQLRRPAPPLALLLAPPPLRASRRRPVPRRVGPRKRPRGHPAARPARRAIGDQPTPDQRPADRRRQGRTGDRRPASSVPCRALYIALALGDRPTGGGRRQGRATGEPPTRSV